MVTRPPRILTLLLLAVAFHAGANPVDTENVTARLVAERSTVAPGETLDLVLVLDIRPGWHTYWKNPGDSGEPPRIDWHLPEGVSAGPIRWPYPDLIRVGPLANYGYSGRAVHPMALSIPADWPVGRPLELAADASWLVCEEHCIPEAVTLRLTLATARDGGRPDLALADIFAVARERQPRPWEGEAALIVDPAGGLRLELAAGDLPERPVAVRFFPAAWGLVEAAAEQPWRIEQGRLVMDLAPGANFASVSPEGVLVVRGTEGTGAFSIAPVRASGPPAAGDPQRALGLPLALGLALLGGLILNLMPCVFPVLAMKALSLAGQGALPARERALHGLSYTAGVLAFFALVAALLLGLRAGGEAVGWGFQLQHPPFVALMAYLFFVLGLSLLGAVSLGGRLMALGAAGPIGGTAGAFVAGALAALVAAPCTAPFMGAALGYAVTLSWPLALAIVLTLGLGLALPYLLLAVIPGAIGILPKPGRWMEDLKQMLAFPLFATTAWLIWVLSVQTGPSGVAAALAGLVVIALGLWLLERTRGASGRVARIGSLAAVVALAAGVLLGFVPRPMPGTDAEAAMDSGAALARPFSMEALEGARTAGRPVFVNMTAAWCITCLVNERVALGRPAVAEAFAAGGVVYLKGDWTNRDPGITRYLEGFGRNGVPIYVYYAPGVPPRVLPQILTESIVLEAIGASESG